MGPWLIPPLFPLIQEPNSPGQSVTNGEDLLKSRHTTELSVALLTDAPPRALGPSHGVLPSQGRTYPSSAA